jgi:sulfite dehydrogenase (quinone) subunit SoeB
VTALPSPSPRKLGLVIDLDTCVGCHACAVACKQWNSGGMVAPLTDADAYGKEPLGVWLNRVHSYEADLSPLPRAGRGAAPASHWLARPQAPSHQRGPGLGLGERAGRCVSVSDAPSLFPLPNPPPASGRGAQGTGSRPASTPLTLHFPRSCLHCENAACVTVCPTGASYKRAEDGIVLVDESKCIGCKLCSWACPYGAREYDAVEGVMKKCTLCVDRIYNESLDEIERVPACVQACPTRARHFGDLGDPDSAVSKLVAEREGAALLPELGYRPVNRYLPPRPRRPGPELEASDDGFDAAKAAPLLRWLDKILSR